MDEQTIEAHIEARANLTGDTFEQAETEVRAMVSEGWTYDDTDGWVPPQG